MKTMQQWFDEYGESHQNPFNKTMHWICVPLIFFSVIGLLASIPVPEAISSVSPYLHMGTLVLAIGLLFYLRISFPMFLGMVVVAVLSVVGNHALAQAVSPVLSLWAVSLIIFVVAWIGQFIGHNVEGKKPSFFKDLQFLMIGPAWLLGFIYRKVGVKY
jgi:uncharacterized membrane protein YGL010W